MLQLVAGLTVVFAGYVLYEVFKTVSQANNLPPVAGPKSEPPKLTTDNEPVVETAAAPEAVPPASTEVAEAAPEPVVKESSPVSGTGAEKAVTALRNPATGETCPVPTNYRFAKKWVKEALVAEGLLDRVFKGTELDDANSKKVKAAIERLKGIGKYQA